jgi:hypothetical protein
MYFKPWVRCGAYFVGVLFGMMYWEYKNQDRHERIRSNLGVKFYNLVKRNAIFRQSVFVTGLVLTTVMVWLPMKENAAFTERYWS